MVRHWCSSRWQSTLCRGRNSILLDHAATGTWEWQINSTIYASGAAAVRIECRLYKMCTCTQSLITESISTTTARRHLDTYRRLSNQTYTAVVTPAFKRCQVQI